MLHVLATLLFSLAGFAALGMIALLLRSDWDAFVAALGLARRTAPPPLPPVSVRPGRRATMLRLEKSGSNWRAAA